MSLPQSPAEAIKEFAGDYLELDAFLFPEEPPLAAHQRVLYRKAQRHRFRWWEWSRGAAKSYTTARFDIVDGLMRPRRSFVYSGPSYRQSLHPFHYAKNLIFQGGPWLARELATDPTENTMRSEIKFRNGTRIVALPASGTKIHGERGTDLVLTEFFEYEKDLYLRSVKPMLAVRGRGPWANTVTIESTAGFQSQHAYQVREQFHREIAAGNPDYCFFSIDLDDLKAIGFPMDWPLIEADRELDEDIFQQQHYNAWLALEGNFYEIVVLRDKELKRGEFRRSALEEKKYAAGGDVARSRKGKGDDSSLSIYEVSPVVGLSPSLANLAVWNDLTAERLADEWAAILGRFNVSSLIMDFRGGGVNVYDELVDRHGIKSADDERPGRVIIEDFPSTSPIINEAHYAFRGACENKRILFPEQPDADTQLKKMYDLVDVGLKQFADLKTERLPSGYLRFEQPSGKKKDVAYAMLYGYWAARQMMRIPGQESRDRGSPIVESDLSRTLIGEDPFGIQA